MNDIRIFEKPEFGTVRTVMDENGEPWFCLSDLCSILDLHDNKVRQRLDDGVLSRYPIVDSLGREQLANFVNEDGLYDTIFDSRKPEARAFRKWVTKEILPSIRKTGEYSVRSNKNKSKSWYESRLIGKDLRKSLTDSIRDSGENERMHWHGYSNYSNLTLKIALGVNPAQFRKDNNISKNDNVRDYLDAEELKKVGKIETAMQVWIELGYRYGDIKDMVDQKLKIGKDGE